MSISVGGQTFGDHEHPVPIITGSKSWDQLTWIEQDDFLMSIFDPCNRYLMVAKKIGFYDFTATTMYDVLRKDISDDQVTMPTDSFFLGTIKAFKLKGTPLGDRLMKAFVRREMRTPEARRLKHMTADPKLTFISIRVMQRIPGYEGLDPDCYLPN